MIEKEYKQGESPLFRALYIRQTWGGVPRTLFLINVLVCIFSVVILGTWIVGAVGLAVHFIFRYLTSQDADFFTVFLNFLQSKDYYRAE